MIGSVLLTVFLFDAYSPPMTFDFTGIGIPMEGSLNGLVTWVALLALAGWIAMHTRETSNG